MTLTWTWVSPYLSLSFKSWQKSESYSSLKERRKSLTPVIIVLSPSSHILSAECLTDPIGKSFTPHLLRQPSHERSFYLPASISQPYLLSNCSRCSRSAVLSARRKSLTSFFFLTISPQRRVISTHLRIISRDLAQVLAGPQV